LWTEIPTVAIKMRRSSTATEEVEDLNSTQALADAALRERDRIIQLMEEEVSTECHAPGQGAG
jgi:hypothetical protein